MSESRPKIPNDIKRNVRKRCGFGCVVCGCPIYEYEHINEWSRVHVHEEENITLLCTKHHGEVTKGIMPKSIVKEFNDKPFNLNKKFSSGQNLYFKGRHIQIYLARNRFLSFDGEYIPIYIPLLYEGEPVLMFHYVDNRWLLSFKVYDDDGNIIFHIKDNEMVYSLGVWDVEFIGKRLTIRKGLYKTVFSITFLSENTIEVDTLVYVMGNVTFKAINREVLIGNNQTYRNTLLHGSIISIML